MKDFDASTLQRKDGYKTKTASRLAAVQALYQMWVTGQSVDSVIEDFQEHHRYVSIAEDEKIKMQTSFFKQLVEGTVAYKEQIESTIIKDLNPGWNFHRLETTLKCILEVAVFELLREQDTPTPIIISEYVDLVQAFFEGREPDFVHSLLNTLAEKHREDHTRRFLKDA